MRIVSVAEFRNEFRSLEEPVEVQRYGKIVGTWHPGETVGIVAEAEPVKNRMAEAQKELEAQAAEIKELKRLLASRGAPAAPISDPSFGRSYPAPKTGKK